MLAVVIIRKKIDVLNYNFWITERLNVYISNLVNIGILHQRHVSRKKQLIPHALFRMVQLQYLMSVYLIQASFVYPVFAIVLIHHCKYILILK